MAYVLEHGLEIGLSLFTLGLLYLGMRRLRRSMPTSGPTVSKTDVDLSTPQQQPTPESIFTPPTEVEVKTAAEIEVVPAATSPALDSDQTTSASPLAEQPTSLAPPLPNRSGHEPKILQEAPSSSPQLDAIWQQGLSRSRASIWGRLQTLWQGKPAINGALLEELEAVLLTADVGVKLTNQFLRALQERQDTPMDADQLRACLQEMMQASLQQVVHLPAANGDGLQHATPPKVILIVGVNGAGKTTTIGKLAKRWHRADQPVVLAAADTFRAAATEQLGIWAERTGCRLVQGAPQSDPSSVVFQAITTAKTEGAAIVLADTAGRLHTDQGLMEEVAKIKRVAGKAHLGAPHEIWLVVDGTAGQNGLQQAKQFHEKLTLTGLILTKVDGSAKGGIVLAIADALRLPVHYVGFGEGAEDLQAFSREQFVRALLADVPAA